MALHLTKREFHAMATRWPSESVKHSASLWFVVLQRAASEQGVGIWRIKCYQRVLETVYLR